MDSNNFDIQSLMQKAKQMQEQMSGAYKDIAEKNKDKTVEGRAGGDMVTATVNLNMHITRIDFKPELLEEEPEVIGELIASAANIGIQNAKDALKKEMMGVTKKMGIPDFLASKMTENL